ncbi:DUF6233 domain-containing protein [Streptomyces lancefieldiae]|uniref:DUF6233 domain-containing protein n=1 Tax=Streptomyces lancefieldiae TaxID=3075520 RepID=A0ABU3AIL1_9ACTN|nr:DUF6233 domain-containing protein [Streptomyces sp. DSM 40712]MDT0608908.1 DUF6233 domain-containing protein [Streptomyces sp. DSM 40712]
MTDLPPDLPRLRTLETWLVLTLDEVRAAIAAAEQREQERQRGIEARPAPPDWLLEQGLNRDSPPVQVHVGDCWNAGKRRRGISRSEALQALADGVRACGACRPDSELGFLEG